MEKTRTRRLLGNTLLLTAAALIMRAIGVWFGALLEDRAGAQGVGLFSLLMSVYSLAATFGTAGLRLAAARLTAEEVDARRRGGGVRRCFGLALLLGFSACLLLYFSADLCAAAWLRDARAAPALRLLAPSLPAAALSAVLSGYCKAAGAVLPYSAVQLTEQGIKIAVTLLALGGAWHISTGDVSESVCAAMALGITAAEWLSLLMTLAVYAAWGRRSRRSTDEAKTPWRSLLRIAVPDGLGACARGGLLTAEHLLIPPGLRKSGADAQKALASYGTIHGMSLPLLLYPSAVLSSLSSLLVPELARLRSLGGTRRIDFVASRLIHLTLSFSLGSAAVFFAFAPQLSLAVYGDYEAAHSLRLLAPLVPIMYLDMTVDGILKGLDEQKRVMRYNVLDSALCVLMVLLVLPPLGVKGYYLVLYASELLNFFLSANRLLSVSDAGLALWESIGKCLLCAGASWGITRLLFGGAAEQMPPSLSAGILIFFMAALYFAMLNAVSKKTNRLGALLK
ncbi:MAG: polysaccharide biosynthesis C-terminal domain-containing protein [Clostridium sp.]|jgi:stage V sporulation protein B|nr:polysaccharide biosynthesis C-terminal domain-containing protein [Clostridium sp.]